MLSVLFTHSLSGFWKVFRKKLEIVRSLLQIQGLFRDGDEDSEKYLMESGVTINVGNAKLMNFGAAIGIFRLQSKWTEKLNCLPRTYVPGE